VDSFLRERFEGGPPPASSEQNGNTNHPYGLRLRAVDPEIAAAIERERQRQQENIELIASENFTSPAVMEAQGSVLTNKIRRGLSPETVVRRL